MKKITSILASAALVFSGLSLDAKKVHTIGDSTMANYDESKTETRGWCQYLQQFLEGITVNNRGKSGSSSKSFYQEAAYWQSVKKQMEPGDIVLIQFAHNDEKTGGVDGDELKAYYNSIGDTQKANAVDYRGTRPSTTYKEYLRKYVEETRAAGCTPILVGGICRMYFTGGDIRRNGRHDLGDSFDLLTETGLKTGQKVPADDHSMDYPYQMKLVAEELNVPYIDLTQGTRELFVSYGDSPCHEILGDGQGSTHLSATGAALIARKFAQMCQTQECPLTQYVKLTSELSVSGEGNFGQGYKGQSIVKEFMVTGYDLQPAAGSVSVTTTGSVKLSTDRENWADNLSFTYAGGTVIERFYAQVTLDNEGTVSGSINITAGDKTTTVPVTAEAVQLSGGQEVTAYWRLESDDQCATDNAPINVIPESWHEMVLQRYSNPNKATVWPDWTGFDASRKTQRNVIEGEAWPAGEIDEVSTRYIEFGVQAMNDTELKLDEISFFVCGCGGNGMCVHVYYSVNDDFSDPQLVYQAEKMPANNMQYIEVKPVISLAAGQSCRLRFYPWYNGAANGKTICLSDVKFHGFVMEPGAGLENVSVAVSEVGKAYYSIDGRQVENPSAGNLYIVKKAYSDGSSKAEKILF